MGVRFTYFTAVSEQTTAEVVEDGPDGLDVGPGGGFDCTVMLGRLGEQLTGVPWIEIGQEVKYWDREVELPEDPEERELFCYLHGIDPDASPEELAQDLEQLRNGTGVVELDPRMRDALAAVPPDGWRPVAQRWLTIEELRGYPVEETVEWLTQMGELARNAVAKEQQLYCHFSL